MEFTGELQDQDQGTTRLRSLLQSRIAEYLQRDLDDSHSQQTDSGLGLQWLPVPHFEIQAEFKKRTQNNSPNDQADVGWILFHLYL